ncbi:alpha/beta hydrolase [Salarchaeum sp. III]|uniref:alpha/beta hydrolase n=1 Tax=Salarchaeum sp. III TaxID=3107927 RepID=UPI002EDB1C44
MRRVDYGDGDDRLVFVLGWGNRPEHDGVQWLVDRLTDAGYRVSAFELPRTITDFDREYLAPVQSFVDDLDDYRLLSHSTGGLVARHLDTDNSLQTRTYLSPWWGFHDDLRNPLVSLATRLPVSTPILPAEATREELGTLASDAWVADAPDYAAPTFLREAKRAQNSLPPFDTRDAVFYNPDDPIVSGPTIEDHAPESNRIAFTDGHELFNSSTRDDHIDAVLAAVEDGANALPRSA